MRFPLPYLAFATLACAEGGSSFDMLSTSVALSRSTVEVHDTLTVALTVKNEGVDAVTFSAPTLCFLVFQVSDADGASLGTESSPCTTVIEEVTLAPGEERQVTIPWELMLGDLMLMPGQYRVRAGIEVVGTEALQALSRPAPLLVVVH